MQKILTTLTLVIISICVCAHGADAPKKESRHDKIYMLQHRVLPRITFNTGGEFYKRLAEGNTEPTKKAISGAVDEKFAKAVTFKKLDGHEAVLITFPKPEKAPQCYYVIIEKTENSFRYVTLEMAEDILGAGTKTMVCEWAGGTQHLNFGSRKYTDAQSFMDDALKKEKK